CGDDRLPPAARCFGTGRGHVVARSFLGADDRDHAVRILRGERPEKDRLDLVDVGRAVELARPLGPAPTLRPPPRAAPCRPTPRAKTPRTRSLATQTRTPPRFSERRPSANTPDAG